MASYRVLIQPSAAKELESAGQRHDRVRLVARIRSLAKQPRPPGCQKLSGQHDLYRICAGAYRIVYQIDDQESAVLVIKIGHRRDVYR